MKEAKAACVTAKTSAEKCVTDATLTTPECITAKTSDDKCVADEAAAAALVKAAEDKKAADVKSAADKLKADRANLAAE